MCSSFRLLLSVLLLSVAALPAAAQTPASTQTFSDTADVIVVEVPVQVLRDGEPVQGLSAQDFEVFEGRNKLPVTGFEVLDLNAGPASEAWKSARAISARRHFLLLFDLGYSSPKGLEKARGAAHDMLAGLHPSDLVGVAAYSPSAGPQLLLGFTTDRRQAAQAVSLLGKPEMFDRVADPLRLVLNSGSIRESMGGAEGAGKSNPASMGGGGGGAAGGREARQAALAQAMAEPPFLPGVFTHIEQADRAAQHRAVTAMTRAFEELARTMGSLYGRKYVVLFSEGFDSSVFGGTADVDQQLTMASATAVGASAWGIDSTKRFGDSKATNDLESMLEEFRRADCVIQAVDVGGLREGAGPAAQWAGGRDSLFLLADSTGGELFENYNDLSAAMEQMLRRTSVTYVLALQPDGLKRDGSYHEIRVELKSAKGARVVHRPGYYAPRPFGQQSPTERLLETARSVAGGQDAGTIATSVLAAPFHTGTGDAYVPVLIEVDGRTLTAGTPGWSVPVEIYAYAFDAQGQARDFFSQTVGLELLKVGAALQQSGLKFFGHLDLPPGDWSVRVLVRNAATGASGFKSTTVHVPEPGKSVLLPAFFPEPAGKWLTIREAQTGSAQAPYPFMSGDQPYIPASLPKLTPGQEAQLSLVAYHLRPGEVQAEARVRTADGRDAGAGRIRIVQRQGHLAGSESLSAVFEPPAGLAPGEYLLMITLTGLSGEAESSVASFTMAGGLP
ncbi:MAG TPA: VWA domain-containing protein [Thermoanaerobaculia bacterium]|nr:VWA domain-containing protein [Thermoanaerobaculia bacterium]